MVVLLEPSTDVEGVLVEGKVSKTKQNVKYKLLFREWGGQKMKYVHGTLIPDICHGRHGYTRVNFFWPV